jgi:dihydrofolate reductase
MRKVILQEFVSIDGFVAGPNDSVDFIPASTQCDSSFGREQIALMDTIDTVLLGRVTYGMFAGFWPNVTEGEQKEFADKFNAVPKVVFSKTARR